MAALTAAPRLRLTAVCAALLLAAGSLEAAARLAWFSAGVEAVGRGVVPVTATGAGLVPALSAVALLALGAVAAAVALAGVARRALGAVVAAAGVGVGVAVARLLVVAPAPADLAALPDAPAGGVAVGVVSRGPGPWTAALGVVLLVAAGTVLMAGERRLHRFGSRFARRPATGSAPAPAGARPGGVADPEPDRAAWDALTAGRDPTAEAPLPTRPGRTDGGGSDRAV